MRLDDANLAWTAMLQDITTHGSPRSPRGQATKELVAYQSRWDMKRPIVTLKSRRLGYRYMAAEAAWIISGDNRVSTIAPYSKMISSFSDDGVTFFGAYGPKFVEQVQYVAWSLAKDADTRQAVATIWRERPYPTKDVPCTIALQWLLRDGELWCVATMRSSDAWLGVPYDVVTFSAMSAVVASRARRLGAQVRSLGGLILTAGSQHLYERNIAAAEPLVSAPIGRLAAYDDPRPLMVDMAADEDAFVRMLWRSAECLAPSDDAEVRADWVGDLISESLAERAGEEATHGR